MLSQKSISSACQPGRREPKGKACHPVTEIRVPADPFGKGMPAWKSCVRELNACSLRKPKEAYRCPVVLGERVGRQSIRSRTQTVLVAEIRQRCIVVDSHTVLRSLFGLEFRRGHAVLLAEALCEVRKAREADGIRDL